MLKTTLKIKIILTPVLLIVLMLQSKAEDKPFLIAALLSLTGDCADVGDLSKKGIELAIKEINAEGGILGRPVKLILEDSNESNSINAVSAYRRLLLNSNIHFLIGPSCSPAALAIAPIAAKNPDVILFSPSVGQREFNETGDNLFKLWPYDEEGPKLLAEYANKKGWKKVAIFSSQQSWEQSQANFFENEFKKLGGKILAKVEPLTSDSDLKSSALKLVHSNPDFIFLSNYTKYEIAAKELHKQGFKGPKLSSLMSEEKIKLAAGTLDETVSYGYQPPTKDFEQNFELMHGNKLWGLSADTAYDITKLYSKTINSAKSDDVLLVRKMLKDIQDYSGASGKFSIDSKGGVSKKPILFQVKGMRLMHYDDSLLK